MTKKKNDTHEYYPQDITWCFNSDTCSYTECFRHTTHMDRPDLPHSYAFFGETKQCELKKQNMKNS